MCVSYLSKTHERWVISLKPQSALGVQRFSIGLTQTRTSPSMEGRTAYLVVGSEAWQPASKHEVLTCESRATLRCWQTAITWLYLVFLVLFFTYCNSSWKISLQSGGSTWSILVSNVTGTCIAENICIICLISCCNEINIGLQLLTSKNVPIESCLF